MRRVVLACVLATACAPALGAQLDPLDESALAGGDTFSRATAAYRRGAYEEADALWRSLLETPLPDPARARLTYDLGNAAWRRGEVLEAIGWYSASIRLEPRSEDAWANLEHARSEAGLDPADRGDLGSTVHRVYVSTRPSERRSLVLFALLLLAVPLGLEAFFGGKLWRRLSVVAALIALPAVAFWIGGFFVDTERDPVLVIQTPSVALRSEPRQSLQPIAQLDPGEQVERIDALPGWVRVERPDGSRGWLREEAVFALRP